MARRNPHYLPLMLVQDHHDVTEEDVRADMLGDDYGTFEDDFFNRRPSRAVWDAEMMSRFKSTKTR